MEEFIKRVEDLYRRNINKNIITYTGFLTPTERSCVVKNYSNTKVFFSGGINEAERVRAFFLPDYIDEIDVEDYITTFKVTFSFRKLSHRDFLGAILSLGIDRRCLGDIYVFNKEAYFFVTNDVANYIKVNLDKVANVGVKLDVVSIDEVKIPETNFEEINFTIPSLRIDSVVSGAIKESREKSIQLIKSDMVLLNYLVCESPSKEVCEGDVFSVKGYGKFLLAKIGGASRRGKIFVKVDKFV